MRKHTLLNYWSKVFLLLGSLSIGAHIDALAGEERYSNYLDVEPNMQKDTFYVQDDRFGNASEWAQINEIIFVNNLLLFEVNEHGRKMISATATFTANIEIGLWRDGDDPDADPTETILETLEFTYDPNTATVTPYRKFKKYNGAHKMRIIIDQILSSEGGPDTAPDLRVSGEIHLSRFYNFISRSAPFITNAPVRDLQSEVFTVDWTEMLGAEMYDLEWVHYDHESEVGAQVRSGDFTAGNPGDYGYLFRNNATRITTANTSYLINLLYRRGYLFFRIRGVQPRDGLRLHGRWSSSLNRAPANFIELEERENDINWQSSVVYAEEGKHIPSTQYFDGTMRNRQSVTLSNAIGRTIVGQTMYDYHGRPAVSALPVPTEQSVIGYQENFALASPTSPFTKEVWEAIDCIEDAPVITNSPASQYYSGDNPRAAEGANKFLPDADGYTYTMTEYTPDLTGRIQTQSGVGEAFAMGKGHETRYYYAKPTQRELDRLFGSDVGDANHYLKNGVMDPNGQLSLSYIDGHGRVIATSLAGAKPDNVQQIDEGYEEPEISTTDILYNQIQDDALVSVYKFIVAAPGEHTFSYAMTSELYTNDCTDLCFDCKYDLTIELSRTDCRPIGTEEKIVKTLSNYTLDQLNNLCETTSMSESFDVTLDVGEHSISKKLSISQESMDFYTEIFLQEENCVPVLEELIDTYMDEIDYTDCDELSCEDCVASLGTEEEYIQILLDAASELELEDPITREDAERSYRLEVQNCMRPCESMTECEAIYGMMVADVSKGGQYAPTLNPSNGEYINPGTSVYVFYNQLHTLAEPVVYITESGKPDTVFNSANQRVLPQELPFQEFMRQWKPSWAQALVNFHPEYCIYEQWCLSDDLEESEAWEEEIRDIESYDEAIDAGIINPDGTFNDPFFDEGAPGFYCVDQRDAMIEHIVPDSLSTPGIIDLAADIIFGDDPDCLKTLGSGTTAENDALWLIVQDLYMGIRQQLVSKSRDRIALNCTVSPPIACIGNDCGEPDNPYRNKQPRFISMDLTGAAITDTLELRQIANETAVKIIGDCQTDCANNADIWLYQLDDCINQISESQRNTLRDRLIAICQSGCDLDHPFGAASSPDGSDSFERAIREVVGGPATSCDIDCNPYVVTGIYPYDVDPFRGTNVLAAQDMADDACMCTQLTELEACYIADPQGYADFGTYLRKFGTYSVPQESIDALKTYCANINSTDPCLARPRDVEIPPVLECGVCKDCDAIATEKSKFDALCSESTTENYFAKLTQFLNYNLGWYLLEEDYEAFIQECGLPTACSATTLLCPTSPSLRQELVDPCKDHLEKQAETNARSEYTRLIEAARKTFREGYKSKCLANMTETFDATLLTHEYHYTLYYYDQAGNLVQTVPPNGVDPIEDAAVLASIDANRKNNGSNDQYPEHSFFTKYVYNSLNQVIRQISPDTDIKQFFYDDVGRLIVSQDGRQRDFYDENLMDDITPTLQAYSYTIYDDLGRIIEVGEKSTTSAFSEDLDFDIWVNEGNLDARTHVTKTYYDEQPLFGQAAIDIDDAANLRTRVAAVTIESVYDGNDATYDYGTHYSYDASGNVQTLVQEIVELEGIGHRYKRMDYDYDYISGNVNAVYYQRGKADQFTHRYTYDANNRLSEVYTSLVHDHANPAGLNVLLWDRDAAYEYYDHGPLSRVEIGEYRIQGMDYAYTLQGWIKGVNSSGLREDKDMGRDGYLNESGEMDPPNGGVARDALAYSLNYYQDESMRDYDPITDNPFMEVENSSLQGASPSLYNGNIRHMTIHNKQLGDPIAYSYIYDQLHRIKSMTSHDNADLDAFLWVATDNEPTKYSMATSYDGNGNILQMYRTGIQEGRSNVSEINNLDYIYEAGTNKLVGNSETLACDPVVNINGPITDDSQIEAGERLIANTEVNGNASVVYQAGEEVCLEPGFEVEAIDPGTFTAQIGECEVTTTNAEYVYDGTGNLIKNESGANISWSPYGKVLAVTQEEDTQVVSFGYDAAQNRSKKSVVNTTTNINKDVYYIRDASGNTMGVYEKNVSPPGEEGGGSPSGLGESMVWLEQYLYGSSRLGGIKPRVEWTTTPEETPTYESTESISLGWKYYEAGNHLGNVLSVANDRKIKVDTDADNEANYFDVTILSASDYYPFGMDMPSRSFANADYRYGFNGKEKDPGAEWGDANHYDYGFRIYNPELGKFLSTDPLGSAFPWNSLYAFAENDVIRNIDLDGAESEEVINALKRLSETYKPEQGNVIIIKPITLTIHSKGSNPPPICCDIQFRKEERPVYKYIEQGGLQGYNNLIVQDHSTSRNHEIEIVDLFTPAIVAWNLEQAQQNFKQSNIELSSAFGPSLFAGFIKNGRFATQLLNNADLVLKIGVKKFTKHIPKLGYKSTKAKEIFSSKFNKIKNAINDHLNDSGLTGAIKDIHEKASNGDHLKKVQDALSGIGKNRKAIKELIDKGELEGDALKAAEDLIQHVDGVGNYVRDILKAAQVSAKRYANGG